MRVGIRFPLLVLLCGLALLACEPKTMTGTKPAPDADMKTVVLNIFGMT
jgi:hypothetical protein